MSVQPVHAQDFRYRVELQVPGSLRPLLEDNLELYKWRDNQDVTQDFLRTLFARTPDEIRKLLATEGYFSPEIRSTLGEEAGEWIARFEIVPGRVVHVESVKLEFSGDLGEPATETGERAARLRADWGLPAGEVFRQADWEKAKRDLLRALIVNRYPRARLADSEARVDPARGTASLSVAIDPGPAFFFGDLEIVGLQQYPERIIDNLNPIDKGAPYDQAQLLELQARLQDSGYFQTVDVRLDLDTPTPGAAPVRVELVEAKSKRVGFGIGYSTDAGPRGRIEYSDSNVQERGWRMTAGVTGDQVEQTLAADLAFPVRRSGARDAINSSYTHKDISGEETDTTRLGVSRVQRAGRFERTLSLQYQREVQALSGIEIDTRQAMTANASWTLRHVDDLLFPREGNLVNLQLGGAPATVLSDRSFLRGYVRGVRYQPLGPKGMAILRAEAGRVLADERSGIPSDFLFRTGGDQTVRGYAYNSLGVPEAGAIVGGRYLTVWSAEYDYWFLPKWGAGFFYDAGNAFDILHDVRLAAGYGLGIRWRTPVGPVNLDVAYGEETERYRLHFSVGFVF